MSESGKSRALAATGWSAGPDAAGRAVGTAREAVGGRAGLVLVFPDETLPVDEAARQAVESAAGAPVAGMTSSGPVFTERGLHEPGCAAIAFGTELQVGVGRAPGASRDPRDAGRMAALAAMEKVDGRPGSTVLLLLLDPEAGDQAAMIDGAYSVARGGVPLAGGGANGSGPRLITGDVAGGDAVVAIAIGSSAPIAVAQAHGCHPMTDPAIVTATEGRTLLELDGRAAEQVYLEGLGHAGPRLEDREFEALAVLHPLAQPQLRGDLRLRHVRGRSAAGGLACSTPIPDNAAVWVTRQTPETIVDSAREAGVEACRILGRRPRAGLVFDCAARRRAVGDRLAEEADALLGALGRGVPLAGLHTRGEVGRTRGAKGDRNHCVVVVAFG